MVLTSQCVEKKKKDWNKIIEKIGDMMNERKESFVGRS